MRVSLIHAIEWHLTYPGWPGSPSGSLNMLAVQHLHNPELSTAA